MKKLNILILVIALSFTAVSANKTKAPVLKNQNDSLNYALGLANGDGIKMYYIHNDSTGKAVEALLKGIDAGMKLDPDYAEFSVIGTNIGETLKGQNKTGLMGLDGVAVNIDLIKQGLINGMRGFNEQMTGQEAQMYMQMAMMSYQERKNDELYGANREAGKLFLEENAKKPGVVTTASGLQYKIEKEGKGKKPTANDVVKVNYRGTLIDGTQFDASKEGTPAVFGVGDVIEGWTEALQLMPVGSKWTLYIPQDLAYGSANKGTIKPYSALIFEVELLSIEK